MSEEEHHKKCPLVAVDRRLDDLHRQWHAAEQAYFDPEEFRVAIQTAIQTLRTVTFILQSNKRLIPDFDAWYGPWQDRMRDDPLLRWMVDARNKIEKQGDLEAHSFVRAEIIASYLENGPRVEIPAGLFDTPAKLLDGISSDAARAHIRKDGVLRVERRWVENTLPDYELLDAVAIAYGKLSLLVADAHRQSGLAPPVTTHMASGRTYPKDPGDGRLPCMVGHADRRSTEFWLATGTPIDFSSRDVPVDLVDAGKIESRYGIAMSDIYGEDPAAEARLVSLFNTARKMFLKDGYHVFIVFLLREGKPASIIELAPAEHGEKYVMMRRIAHEVTKHGADAVIVISEAWSAPINREKPYMRAVDSPDREEYLGATLVSKSGEPVMLRAKILRKGDAATLADTSEERGGAHFLFAPIYAAWGKQVPKEWLATEIE